VNNSKPAPGKCVKGAGLPSLRKVSISTEEKEEGEKLLYNFV